MKKIVIATVFAALLSSAAYADVVNSPVKSVTMSSGGLAEIRRTATLDGNGEIQIEVPLGQVNDVLKSLVVFDPKGSVKDISLAGPDPLQEGFRNLPFSANDLSSIPSLLAKLKGTKIQVNMSDAGAANKSLRGTVLGVENTIKDTIEVPTYLTLKTDDGFIKKVTLSESTEIQFLDPKVASEIDAATAIVGRNVTDKERDIVVKLNGKGKRDVDFSYVVAAPVWKTAYRVVVGKDGKARMQAWAVFENATGEDWKNVKVGLNSSAPVTLTQRLYDLYWKHRDELPILVDNVGLPPIDDGKMKRPAPQAPVQRNQADGLAFAEMSAKVMDTQVAAAPVSQVETGTATEDDISAKFDLQGSFDLANGDTLSVPIIDKDVDAELVSLYRPDRGSNHPIAAVSLHNTTGTSLPGGILTVYDRNGGYVGDSALKGLPIDETRMSSFALDKKVTVISDSRDETKTIDMKISDGVLTTRTGFRQTTTYTVIGAPDADRNVVIEQPKITGWTFKSDAFKGESASDYRLEIQVPKGKTATVKAVMEREGPQSFRLTDVDEAAIAQWSDEAADPIIKDKLSELAKAKKAESDARRDLDRLVQENQQLQSTQQRARSNIASMPSGGDAAKRFIDKVTEIETKIESNEAAQQKLKDAIDGYHGRVGDIIRTF